MIKIKCFKQLFFNLMMRDKSKGSRLILQVSLSPVLAYEAGGGGGGEVLPPPPPPDFSTDDIWAKTCTVIFRQKQVYNIFENPPDFRASFFLFLSKRLLRALHEYRVAQK